MQVTYWSGTTLWR